MLKSELRARALAARPPPVPAAAQTLAAIALDQVSFPRIVAGVWPLPNEMDLRPLLHMLHGRGHVIVLPHTPAQGRRLEFRVWVPGAPMIQERFGTWRPDGALTEPDMLLVPLLAFDRAGNRLGYGGGFYDCTLAQLVGRPAIGFGYAALEVPAVPAEPHDQRLAAILTEREFIRVADAR